MGLSGYLEDLAVLQKVVLIFVGLSWLLWFSCTCLYIPYVLFFAPKEPVDPTNPMDFRLKPAHDYYSGQVSAVAMTCGLFVDSVMLAGIYKKYDVQKDLIYPWLFFYALIIAGLVALSAFVTIEVPFKFAAAASAVLAVFYIAAYFHAVLLFQRSGRKSARVLTEMRNAALEPIVEKVHAEVASGEERQKLNDG